VIREAFWTGKPVLGGCVNKIPVSGRVVLGAPYFQYSDTFEVGENVYAALDPGIIDPGNVSKMCALYVVPSKNDAQWNADNSLNHLAILGGNGAVPKLKVQAGCVNANKVLVWPNANVIGEYDIVADFGNNVPDAAAFTTDAQYNTPLDVIDGYFVAGFRIVEDPGTLTDPGLFAGNWNYDPTVVSGLGLLGTVSVDDENSFYATPGAFSVLSRQVQLRANVFFPADAAGVTDPAQISATKPDYPLVVIVHGNGHNYTAYDFLLRHLAQNGFVAASIDNRYLLGGSPAHGMHGLGRANNFFRHLAVLKAKFGPKLQNNIGVMGHSRGGEGVVKIARLNQQLALGNNVNAVLSLAPTDQYGKEVLAGAFTKPFFVLYGSRDGDVAGWHPSALGIPGFDWRMTGFSLYDRAADAPKSMAFIYRATHNGFITTNSDNPGDTPLSEATQQAITRAYTTAFFRQHLRSESKWNGMFTGEWKPASVAATGAELYLQHSTPGGKTVDNFEGAVANWQTSTLGGAVSHGGSLPVDPEEGRLFDFPPGNPGLDNKSPHDSKGLKVRWDNAGDRLVWTIPPAHKDVTTFAILSLRVTQKEASASNPANQPQDLRVTLRDGANNQRAVRVGAFGVIPFPDQRSNTDLRKSAFTTIRIPLTAYTIVCAGQPKVALSDLVELALDFTQGAPGEIEVDEIEFTT
jgi:dienelactone hydrolase